MKRYGNLWNGLLTRRSSVAALVAGAALSMAPSAGGYGLEAIMRLADPQGARAEFQAAEKRVERLVTLRQTNYNRKLAAEKHVHTLEAAYQAGNASYDLLLDARRRLTVAEIAYAEVTLELAGFLSDGQRDRLTHAAKRDAYVAARNQALREWKEAYAAFRQVPQEVLQREGQARERFFELRALVEDSESDGN